MPSNVHPVKEFQLPEGGPLLRVGQKLEALTTEPSWNAGDKLELVAFGGDPGEPLPHLFGIAVEIPSPGFHDMNGFLDGPRGYWLKFGSFERYFKTASSEKVEISSECSFRRHKLKGKSGIVLSKNEKEAIVELDENIGAGSGDGVGKKGHCVVLPLNVLKEIRKNKKK